MPAGATYEPIATQTLVSAASTITFSSISATYTDLVLVTRIFANTGGLNDYTSLMQINGDTASNYSTVKLAGNGTNAVSTVSTNANHARINTAGYLSTTIPQNSIINIMNYANTTTYKSILVRSNQVDTEVNTTTSMWRSTSAVTSLRFFIEAGNMGIGSTFTLYGIKAA
jgi:hypothetical protein